MSADEQRGELAAQEITAAQLPVGEFGGVLRGAG